MDLQAADSALPPLEDSATEDQARCGMIVEKCKYHSHPTHPFRNISFLPTPPRFLQGMRAYVQSTMILYADGCVLKCGEGCGMSYWTVMGGFN